LTPLAAAAAPMFMGGISLTFLLWEGLARQDGRFNGLPPESNHVAS